MLVFDRVIKNIRKFGKMNITMNMRGNSNAKMMRVQPRTKTLFNNNRCIYKLVNKETAAELIRSNNVILIDVRTKREYDAIHIQNAINIPVEEMLETLRSVNLDNNKNIMIYCSTGTRSKEAIRILNQMGYTNILIWDYSAITTFPYKDMFVYAK